MRSRLNSAVSVAANVAQSAMSTTTMITVETSVTAEAAVVPNSMSVPPAAVLNPVPVTVTTVPPAVEPDAGLTGRVRTEALKRGLILLTCGVYGETVRLLAPLTIQPRVLKEGLDILEAALVG